VLTGLLFDLSRPPEPATARSLPWTDIVALESGMYRFL
jgi:hypothetical protein